MFKKKNLKAWLYLTPALLFLAVFINPNFYYTTS